MQSLPLPDPYSLNRGVKNVRVRVANPATHINSEDPPSSVHFSACPQQLHSLKTKGIYFHLPHRHGEALPVSVYRSPGIAVSSIALSALTCPDVPRILYRTFCRLVHPVKVLLTTIPQLPRAGKRKTSSCGYWLFFCLLSQALFRMLGPVRPLYFLASNTASVLPLSSLNRAKNKNAPSEVCFWHCGNSSIRGPSPSSLVSSTLNFIEDNRHVCICAPPKNAWFGKVRSPRNWFPRRQRYNRLR